MIIYSYIGLIFFPFFLIAYLGAFYFLTVMFINGLKLKLYTQKRYPNIRVSFFIFIHKKDKCSWVHPLAPIYLLRLILEFGSKKSIDRWLNLFMDISRLRKTNDNKIDHHLDKLVASTRWYIRLLTLALISTFIVMYLLIPIESYFFNFPPQP